MARGHRKKKGGGKRKMGAASRAGKSNKLMTGIGVGLGLIGTAFLDRQVFKKTDNMVKGGIALALGAGAAWKLKSGPLVTGVALGMAGWGGLSVVNGISKGGIIPTTPTGVSGFRDVAQIAGPVEQQQARIRKFPNPSAIGNPRTRRAGILAQG